MTSAPAGARRGVRRAVDFECELISARSDRIHHYRVTNLSADGMWLHTPNPARAGEQVVVCFQPNNGWRSGELRVFGEVVRVTSIRPRPGELPPDVGMAVELLDLSAEEERELLSWLRARRAPVPRRRRPLRRAQATATEPMLAAAKVLPKSSPAAPTPRVVCWR